MSSLSFHKSIMLNFGLHILHREVEKPRSHMPNVYCTVQNVGTWHGRSACIAANPGTTDSSLRPIPAQQPHLFPTFDNFHKCNKPYSQTTIYRCWYSSGIISAQNGRHAHQFGLGSAPQILFLYSESAQLQKLRMPTECWRIGPRGKLCEVYRGLQVNTMYIPTFKLLLLSRI